MRKRAMRTNGRDNGDIIYRRKLFSPRTAASLKTIDQENAGAPARETIIARCGSSNLIP